MKIWCALVDAVRTDYRNDVIVVYKELPTFLNYQIPKLC